MYSTETILYCFWDIARYWSKIATFSHPLHSTPPLGGSRSEYCHCHIVWCGKIKNGVATRWWKKSEDMNSRLDRIPACDRHTDRQTSCHSTDRATHTCHAVKTDCDICQRYLTNKTTARLLSRGDWLVLKLVIYLKLNTRLWNWFYKLLTIRRNTIMISAQMRSVQQF